MMKTPLISRSTIKIGWRHLMRSPWQTLLMTLGIMLGVAVVVAIDLANESASVAFNLSTEAITGRTTDQISQNPDGLDESSYAALRRAGLPYPSAPLIREYVTSPQLDNLPIQLLGIDPFAEAPLRNYLSTQNSAVDPDSLYSFLTTPGGVLLSTDLAGRNNLGEGDLLDLSIGGKQQQAVIVGLVEPADDLSRRALNGIILADIATVQEFTGRIGKLDRIDLILPAEADYALEQIRSVLGESGAVIQPVAARSSGVDQMTAAFRTNLTALSMLALIVGVFLIYNTMTFSVVQRRAMFGTLRCLGLTREEVFSMVILEAFLAGTIGGVLGILLGLFLGQGSVRLVTQTINDLFFVVTVQDIALPYSSILKGGLLGIFATVLAAAPPAWEAASVPPRQAMVRSSLEQKTTGALRWIMWGGFLVIIIGTGLLLIPTRSLVIGFGGTFSIVLGFAMLTPMITRLLMNSISRLFANRRGAITRMAPRQVVGAISRTSVAIAALMIALSVSIGVNLMISSFRHTVVVWMEQILSGDIYVSSLDTNLTLTNTVITPEVLEILEDWPGVGRQDLLRSVTVDSPYGLIEIDANNNPQDGEEQVYLWVDGEPMEAWARVQQGAILVSEPLARRLDLPLDGGSLTLFTDQGPADFPIVGIYHDYSSSQGSVIMWLEQYRGFWADDKLTAVALKLEPGTDADQVTADLQRTLAPVQPLNIRPNQALRAATLEVFDRTFAITGALQLLATLVAFIGVVSAMLSLQLEKQRQMGMLRALGLTIRQLWQLVLFETGLMGAVAGLMAIPTGYVLALILIFIINQRSFGWTLQLELVPAPFIQAFVVAVVAALLAGLYPAWRVSRRVAAEALRFE
jgi:putative ABC transport system permease protein